MWISTAFSFSSITVSPAHLRRAAEGPRRELAPSSCLLATGAASLDEGVMGLD